MRKTSPSGADFPSSSGRSHSETVEYDDALDLLRARKLDLFTVRQRLLQRRLSGDSLPGFREDYGALRRDEEEVRLAILQLENRWRARPLVYPRSRPKNCPKATRRLRRWLNFLMITTLLAYLLLYYFGR